MTIKNSLSKNRTIKNLNIQVKSTSYASEIIEYCEGHFLKFSKIKLEFQKSKIDLFSNKILIKILEDIKAIKKRIFIDGKRTTVWFNVAFTELAPINQVEDKIENYVTFSPKGFIIWKELKKKLINDNILASKEQIQKILENMGAQKKRRSISGKKIEIFTGITFINRNKVSFLDRIKKEQEKEDSLDERIRCENFNSTITGDLKLEIARLKKIGFSNSHIYESYRDINKATIRT
jgi:hypothetical protein